MKNEDIFGNTLTVEDTQTLGGIHDFIDGFLSYTPKILHILPAADQAPHTCIANAYAAFLYMFMEHGDGIEPARQAASRAQKAKKTASRREARIADIAKLWALGDAREAQALCEHVLTEHPRDLTTLKLGQYLAFNIGDSLSMLRMANLCEQANQDIHHFHSMNAFAFEQCHLLDDAKASAQSALALYPEDPWAHHALAHIYLTTGQIDEGLQRLTQHSPSWSGLNSFMYTHNWWHLGLFHISRGDFQAALAIFDDHLWTQEKTYSQDQIGAVSYLARLEMAGIDVGNRWLEPADYIVKRGADVTLPFLSVQYYLGLLRANRTEAKDLFAAIKNKSETSKTWQTSALPLARGIQAMANNDPRLATIYFKKAMASLQGLGGSHAQRDLFDQLYLEAVIKSGQFNTAQQILELRRTFDKNSVPINMALADIYSQNGLDTLANIAAKRAQKRLDKIKGPYA